MTEETYEITYSDSRKTAERYVNNIVRYWGERGYTPAVWIESFMGPSHRTIHAIHSDMVDGIPPR